MAKKQVEQLALHVGYGVG